MVGLTDDEWNVLRIDDLKLHHATLLTHGAYGLCGISAQDSGFGMRFRRGGLEDFLYHRVQANLSPVISGHIHQKYKYNYIYQ